MGININGRANNSHDLTQKEVLEQCSKAKMAMMATGTIGTAIGVIGLSRLIYNPSQGIIEVIAGGSIALASRDIFIIIGNREKISRSFLRSLYSSFGDRRHCDQLLKGTLVLGPYFKDFICEILSDV